ncbi:MAG TPA: universal stress protein [Gaiellaceae bacterium]|jgi:nucleotide-binding universal stress UspA family protein
MFKNIVWATDGSESAERALAYAKELASRSDAKLYAVHSDEHLVGGRSAGYPVLADEPELRKKIQVQVEAARTEGFDASFETVHCTAGRTPHTIADFAQSVDADVIVVGTRGRSPLAGVLLGSVTQGLLHSAPCPVLAVPPAAVPAPKDEALAVAGA